MCGAHFLHRIVEWDRGPKQEAGGKRGKSLKEFPVQSKKSTGIRQLIGRLRVERALLTTSNKINENHGWGRPFQAQTKRRQNEYVQTVNSEQDRHGNLHQSHSVIIQAEQQ